VKLAIPAMLYGLARGLPILRGAGPWCAATIVGRRVIGGTRMPDEFVRHKIVDMLGDFALLGAPLLGRVTALRPTHDGNYGLMTALMRKKTAWHLVEVDPALAV
jgi:UDP-3-O-[3-hydroxymyristoyl] N-acetylglucosamine deacetylase